MPALCVGVDAGGSRTVAAVARGDDVLRTFVGEAANPQAYGIERAASAIARAIEGALAYETAAAIAVGAAGAGREETSSALRSALALRFPGVRIAVTDDAHIALRAAIASGDAGVLIAGTGSIAYAEVGGKRVRAGGYGYALGDEGSGYAIGAAALRLLLHAYEERAPRGAMLDALAARLGASSAQETIARVYSGAAPVRDVAACAPLVLGHAQSGERDAGKIVQSAALALFDLVRALVRLTGTDGDFPIAFAGGLLHENSLLTYLLETRIGGELPDVRVVKGGEPYLGALAGARALLT